MTERSRLPASSMFELRVHALITGIVVFAIGVVLCAVIAVDPANPAVQTVDDHWLDWTVDIRSPWSTRLSKAVSFFGSPTVTLPLRIVIIAALAWRRRWLQLTAFLAVVVTSELCIGPLKALIDRPRPPGSLIETGSSATPSGHAIAGAVTGFGLVIVLLPSSPRRWRWIGCAAAFAGLMSISRTVLGAHWLTDVISGMCLGTGLALMWPAALELGRARYHQRRDAVPVR